MLLTLSLGLGGKGDLAFPAVTTVTGLAVSLRLQAVAVGNPAYRDAPVLPLLPASPFQLRYARLFGSS